MTPSFIAFDLDGTVFERVDDPRISARVRRALELAHAKGVPVISVSGRPWMLLGPTLLRAPWLTWRVGANGAEVTDAGNRTLLTRPLDHAIALEALGRIREPGYRWDMMVPGYFYFECRHPHRWPRNARLPVMRRDGICPHTYYVRSVLPIARAAEQILKIQVEVDEGLDPAPALEALGVLAERCGGLEVAVMDYGIEVTAAGVDKADTLSALLAREGIDPARGVAFGDGANDLPMTRGPWRFVAMGNADPAIIAAADEVTDSVTEDGVAAWIEANL